ncbi:hypothetical protein HXX01_04690, partial [Candidatus Nomurabacteria bacterium]|nr:hypothetical protein [Candidatus Nomurabacteria bacterium]
MKTIKSKKYSILFGLLKYSFVFLFIFTIMTPMVLAVKCPDGSERVSCPNGATISANTGQEANTGGEADTGKEANTGGVNINTNIKNPLGSKITDLSSFIKAVVEIVLVVGIPLLALAIIYAGFLFVKAQGNSEELTKAKHALL